MPIKYLNTDLDLAAPVDLTPLVEVFEPRGVFPLHINEETPGRWVSRLETEKDYPDPESNIRAMLDVIEASSEDTRTIWDACSQREFNIGYECGDEPWAFNQGLSTTTLHRMAEAGATLRITIDPPDRFTSLKDT